MATIYTDRLGAGDLAPGAFVDIGTCPPGRHWVLRDVSIFNGSGIAGSANIYIHSGSLYFGVFSAEVTPYTAAHYEGRQVLHTGEAIAVQMTSMGGQVLATGYDFAAD